MRLYARSEELQRRATAGSGGDDDEGGQKHLDQMDTPNRAPAASKIQAGNMLSFVLGNEGHNEAAEPLNIAT